MPPPPLPQGYGSPAHPTASPSHSGGWVAQNGSTTTTTTQPYKPTPMRTESEDAFDDDWSDDDSQTQVSLM